MEIRVALLNDIEGILNLQEQNLVSNLKDNEKEDGFVTTPFEISQLEALIKEEGIFLALENNKVEAYVMCASWHYWLAWPMFEYMASFLETLSYKNQKLSMENSYQYGPICVSKECRGSGTFEALFEFARVNMNKRYPILITFINKINTRSYEAHVRKLKLEVIHEFEFNNNSFYELAYDTSVSVK